jgi:hypothetical protein
MQADKQKEMTKKHLAHSDHFGGMASRRDASPGRTAHRPPLHSVRNASFDDLAHPFCSASTKHGGDAFRRNATGGGGRFFYQATHPSGMSRCRGFFVGLSLVAKRRSHPAPRAASVFRRRRCAAFRSVLHPGGMHRCRGFFVGLSLVAKRRSNPAPRVASMFRRRRCAAFRSVLHPSGMPLCRVFFCGSVIGRSYIMQADKQKEMTKKRLTLSDNFGETASRRDASLGRTAHHLPLHSVRNASFDDLAHPFCSASTKHGGDAFRRNATGGGRAFFYRAAHPSGMPRCRGFFCESVIGRFYILQAAKQKEMTKTPVIAGLTRNLQIAFMDLGDCGSEAAMTESAGGSVIGRSAVTKQSGAARSVRVLALAEWKRSASVLHPSGIQRCRGFFCGSVIGRGRGRGSGNGRKVPVYLFLFPVVCG